jgi:alpha-ketoglutarate-dependent taurine dioxygenase
MAVAAPPPLLRPLGATFGRSVEPAAAGQTIGDLAAADIAPLFREHGALLFRGFGATREEFLAFSDRLSTGFSTYQGGFFRDRQKVGDHETLLTVTGSQEGFAIPLHGEMYYTARQPALLWFYCEAPAAEGGETTLADGEEVYRLLSARARALFEGQRVKYVRHLPAGAWRQAFQTDYLAEAERFCRAEATELRHDPETDAATTEYLAWAIAVGRSGRRDTFINNVVSLYLGELSFKRGTLAQTVKSLSGGDRFPTTVRMEDGSPVPGAVVKELMAINERHAARVAWQAGEVLLVDNRRVLHGRLAHRGERQVYVRLAEPAF